MYAFMYLYPENLPAGSMPKQKVYLIAGKSPSQMEMMKVQLFQSTARWVHLRVHCNNEILKYEMKQYWKITYWDA